MKLVSPRYAFLTAFLKGQESWMLSWELLEKMIQSATVPDAVETIRETDIGRYLSGQSLSSFSKADECLWEYLGMCIERFTRYNPPGDMLRLCRAYVLKYDIVNIKSAIRRINSENKISMVSVGTIHDSGLLEHLSNAKSTADVVGVLEKIRLEEYAVAVASIKEDDLRSLLDTERKLEQLYHMHLLKALKTMNDAAVIIKAIGITIDLFNLRLVFRTAAGDSGSMLERFVLDGGYTFSAEAIRVLFSSKVTEMPGWIEHSMYHQIARESIRQFEHDMDSTVFDRVFEKEGFGLLKDLLSPRVLSPLNALWYLMLKEWEIRNVRLIFKALFEVMPAEEVREYLAGAL